MDSRIQRFLVAALMSSMSAPMRWRRNRKDLELEPLVVREPERREVNVDEIDSENFEIGAYGGILDIQDFGSNAVYGARAAYHVTEDFFIEGPVWPQRARRDELRDAVGQRRTADGRRSRVQLLQRVGRLQHPAGRSIRRTQVRVPRRTLSDRRRRQFGLRAATNASRSAAASAIAWRRPTGSSLRIDVRDYVFESDLLGSNETLHNLEFTGGLTVFF